MPLSVVLNKSQLSLWGLRLVQLSISSAHLLKSTELKLDGGIRTLKKSAKYKLFKDFQFYSRSSCFLIFHSYLIPTVLFHQFLFMKVGENQLVFPDTVNVSIALCNFEIQTVSEFL